MREALEELLRANSSTGVRPRCRPPPHLGHDKRNGWSQVNLGEGAPIGSPKSDDSYVAPQIKYLLGVTGRANHGYPAILVCDDSTLHSTTRPISGLWWHVKDGSTRIGDPILCANIVGSALSATSNVTTQNRSCGIVTSDGRIRPRGEARALHQNRAPARVWPRDPNKSDPS